MNNITTTYCSRYYGFPAYTTVSRRGYDKCLDIQFHFPEGYCPNGCQMYKVKEKIEKLFNVKAIIEAQNSINTDIKFKFPFPYVTNERKIKQMNEDMLSGIAATLFTLLIRLDY
jgi:hypothetical protein